jgi:hypothetical protein
LKKKNNRKREEKKRIEDIMKRSKEHTTLGWRTNNAGDVKNMDI